MGTLCQKCKIKLGGTTLLVEISYVVNHAKLPNLVTAQSRKLDPRKQNKKETDSKETALGLGRATNRVFKLPHLSR